MRAKRVLYFGELVPGFVPGFILIKAVSSSLTVNSFALFTFRKAVSVAIITARQSMAVYAVNLLKVPKYSPGTLG